jgi:two-component system, sporulation sensor kinase E
MKSDSNINLPPEDIAGSSRQDASLTQENDTLKQELDSLTQENVALSQQNVALSQESAALSQENASLRASLSQLKSGEAALERAVTERKQAEEALRLGEERFRLLIENARDAILRLTLLPALSLEYVSPSVAAITGYTPEEFYADPELIFKAVYPEDLAQLVKISPRELERPLTTRMIKKDGTIIYTEHYLTPIFGKTGELTAIEGITRDVTERKQAEEALSLSEERFSRVFRASPCMMAIVSLPDYRFVDVNRHWLNTIGCAYDEVIGKTVTEYGHWSDAQTQQVIGSLDESGSAYNREIRFRTRQGKERQGLWSGEIITINGERCLLGVTRDITELKQLQQEMARLDRLNLVGEMAAGIAHEIRNPMTVIRGYLQMLQLLEEFAPHSKRFDTMIEEIDRVNAIITEFLSLARNTPSDLKKQSINTILAALLPLIQVDAAKNGIAVSTDLGDTPELELDEKQIRQLVLNLVRNGIEAMSRYGELTIKTRRKKDGVVLMVKDRGEGIPPDALEKLGTPFFTTKEGGTGLGLPICYRIAESHNASIQVKTTLKGTIFMVHFKQKIS